MNTNKYNWERIKKDIIKIIAANTSKGNKPITKTTQLYKLFENKYKKAYESNNTHFPKINTFRQYIHQNNWVTPNKKNLQDDLYKLAAKYSKLTIDTLCENIAVTSNDTANNSCWLFIKL